VLRAGLEPATCRSVVDNRNRSSPQQESNSAAGPPGFEPGPARLELAVLPLTPRAYRERTTRIERASPGWRPGALPSELRPRTRPAGVEPAASAVAEQRSVTELRA
jgi:hypothetical protein